MSATNGVGTATQAITLTVKSAKPTETVPTITSAPTATATAGAAFSFTVTTAGRPTTYATNLSHSGALPAGVSFANKGNGTATVAGTPKATSGGLYTLTFRATNAAGTTTQSFALNVGATPAITSGAEYHRHRRRRALLHCQDHRLPTAGAVRRGTLAAGLSFVDNGNGTATLSGAPDAGSGGTYKITISATNSVGTTTQTFALTVRQPPLITGPSTASAVHGTVSTFTFSATGYPVPTMAHAGTVAGLSWTAGGGALL